MHPSNSPQIAQALARLPQSLPGWFGFEVIEQDHGRLRAQMAIEPRMLAPNGFLHAASVVLLADSAAGFGCMGSLPEGAESFTTIELKSNFFGTARDGVLGCTAELAHAGRSTQVWDARVYRQADNREIALFRCTQMILYPRGESR